MTNTFDAARRVLAARRNQLQARRQELDRQLKALDSAIFAMDAAVTLFDGTEHSPLAPTDTLRLLVTRRVSSQSYPRQKTYAVTAWHEPIRNKIVYRCTCPSFTFAKPDAFFDGEKTHCKHIRKEMTQPGASGLACEARRTLNQQGS